LAVLGVRSTATWVGLQPAAGFKPTFLGFVCRQWGPTEPENSSRIENGRLHGKIAYPQKAKAQPAG
jgi:hypothetical protein